MWWAIGHEYSEGDVIEADSEEEADEYMDKVGSTVDRDILFERLGMSKNIRRIRYMRACKFYSNIGI